MYKPTILLDKSTVRGLKTEEIKLIQTHYIVIVPQVLIREILGELSKQDEDHSKIKNNIRNLSERLEHHQTIFYPDALSIAKNELLTGQNLPFSGQPISFNPKSIQTKDGKLGYLIEEPDELKILRRWKNGIFTNEEIQASQSYYEIERNFDLNKFKEEMKKLVDIPVSSDSVKHIYNSINKIFEKIPNETILDKLFEIFQFSDDEKKRVLDRWRKNKNNSVMRFSPFAYYFLTVFVTFSYGIKLEIISSSKRAKSHIDLEYFFYLPLINVVSSGDKLFKELFDAFSLQKQIIFNIESMKTEVLLIGEDVEFVKLNKNNPEKIVQTEFKSVTYKLWFKEFFHPFNQENLAEKLSEQQLKKIADEVLKPLNEGIDFYSKEPINKSHEKLYEGWSDTEKFFESAKNAREIFHVDNGFNHVKKNISADQIKHFFSLYADMWPPNCDIFSSLPQKDGKIRGLYLGGFEPQDVNEILYMTLMFDELILIDPIPNPWYLKSEYNPINNPEKFKQETLKYLWLYFILEPFVNSGLIRVIRSPFHLGSESHNELIQLSQARIKSLGSEEFKEIFKMEYRTQNRNVELVNFFSLPSKNKIEFFKKNKPGITDDEMKKLISYYNRLRELHAFALDQELENYEQVNLMHGVNLEEAFFISSDMGCIPITNSKSKNYEINKVYGNNRGDFRKIIQCFNKVKLDLASAVYIPLMLTVKESGIMDKYIMSFKNIYTEIISRNFRKLKSNNMKNKIESDLYGLQESFSHLLKMMQKVNNVPLEYESFNIKLICSDEGAHLPGLEALYKKYSKNGVFRYPPISISLIQKNE